jgi:hypothetical protein
MNPWHPASNFNLSYNIARMFASELAIPVCVFRLTSPFLSNGLSCQYNFHLIKLCWVILTSFLKTGNPIFPWWMFWLYKMNNITC